MLAIRPKILEPVFTLYSRPVHPEFFGVVAERSLVRNRYEVSVAITNVGHVLVWTDGRRTLTEIVSSVHHELPCAPLFRDPVHGVHEQSATIDTSLVYRTSFRFESVEPETLFLLDKEFSREEGREGLVHRFGQNGRIALGAVSYVRLESRAGRLFVQAVHTFPDDLAFVRTESLIALR